MCDVTYDPEADVYRYDLGRDESISDAVVRAVASVTDQDPVAIGPLYEAVDPDALEAVVESLGRHDGEEWSVRFTLDRCHVTVRSDETVELRFDPARSDDRGGT